MQTVVIGLVLLISTAASTLALGLLVDSNAPFDHAFAAQHGSEVTATAQATTAQLAATAHLPGVTAAAGPFPETTINATIPFTPPPGQGPPGVFQTAADRRSAARRRAARSTTSRWSPATGRPSRTRSC